MKSKKLSSLIGALSCAIFIAACSNSSDTPNVLGQTQRAVVFASAKTALKAMDVSLDLTNGLSSNVSKSSTLALGEIESGQTLPADKYFEINETDKNGQGIGINRWADYSADQLKGKTSQSQCILEMCKKEVPEKVAGLDFNKDFAQELSANYTIGSNSMTIVLKKFRINHTIGSDEMTVLSTVDVYAANDTARATNYGPYNSILKCKLNSVGTLDTELYMVHASRDSEKHFAKFVRKSLTEKTKTSLSKTQSDNNRWEDVTVTASGITGYKHANSRKHYISIRGDYSAMWFNYGSNVSQVNRAQVMDSDGRVIKYQEFDANGSAGACKYFLNFISGLTGYKVKNANGSYKLLNANDAEVASLSQETCYKWGNNSAAAYTYAVTESEMKNAKLSCSVALKIAGLDEAVKNKELKDADYISESRFDLSLPTALASWLSN